MPLCFDNTSKGLATIRFLDVKPGLMLICNTLKQVKRWVILCLFYEYLLQHSRLKKHADSLIFNTLSPVLPGVSYKFMSVCQFVRPSVLPRLIFLKIGSLVFSNILHEVWRHNGWKMMEPDISKKSGFPVFGGKVDKMAHKCSFWTLSHNCDITFSHGLLICV